MSNRCLHVLLLALALAMLLAGRPAEATLVRRLDLPELVATADRIVVADVQALRTAWDASHRTIYTTVELRVRESWKGPLPSDGAVVIRHLGGTVGEIEMTVHGAPTFSVGERALLFLRGPHVVGMAQGKRPLRWEAATRRWRVMAADRASTVHLDSRGGLHGTEPEPAEDLDTLRARIRRLVEN
jgi:hypothetical protein